MLKFFQRAVRGSRMEADYYIVVSEAATYTNSGCYTDSSRVNVVKLHPTRKEVCGQIRKGYSPTFDGGVFNRKHAGGIIPLVFLPLGETFDEDGKPLYDLPKCWHMPTRDGMLTLNEWSPITHIDGLTNNSMYEGVFIAKTNRPNVFVFSGMPRETAESMVEAFTKNRHVEVMSEDERSVRNNGLSWEDPYYLSVEKIVFQNGEVIPFFF